MNKKIFSKELMDENSKELMDEKAFNKKLFAERLQALRKDRGYKTQSSLASAYNAKYKSKNPDKSGILGSIKKWENDSISTVPTLDKICNLCELLECDLNYLIGKTDCSTVQASDFKKETGLSENSFEQIKKLYKEHKSKKEFFNTTEFEVLESIINNHNGNVLNAMWGRIVRTYPKHEIKVNTVGNGWTVYPDDLRQSDNMLLYYSLLRWIDNYQKIIDTIEG